MSNRYVTEYCDHRNSCTNTGCSRKALPTPRPQDEEIAYSDQHFCTKFKPTKDEQLEQRAIREADEAAEGGEGERTTMRRGKDVVLVGIWKPEVYIPRGRFRLNRRTDNKIS
jgi:hypothetical protein